MATWFKRPIIVSTLAVATAAVWKPVICQLSRFAIVPERYITVSNTEHTGFLPQA